jgi:diguanylate cyclase
MSVGTLQFMPSSWQMADSSWMICRGCRPAATRRARLSLPHRAAFGREYQGRRAHSASARAANGGRRSYNVGLEATPAPPPEFRTRAMIDTDRRQPWLVVMNYRMRTASFAGLFVAIALHIADRGDGFLAWLGLIAALLIYPQLLFALTTRSRDPLAAEMRSLIIDSVILGAVAAALGFPLWIAVSATLATLINNAAIKGWGGVGVNILALAAGVALGITLTGFRFSPETGWPATLICIVGTCAYMVGAGMLSHNRNQQLRQAREQLLRREAQLVAANESLVEKLGEIDELHELLSEQANRDSLTGLYNRRYLDSTLDRELQRCKRDGQPLALLLIDIDRFKLINDTYGHQAGDHVIVSVGQLLSGMVRAGDIACRYGGEEFMVVLPTMALDLAFDRAEKLRSVFAAAIVRFGEFQIQATLSIGISVYPGNGTSTDDLIHAADHALYRAKRTGRNRVEIESAVRAKTAAAAVLPLDPIAP